MKKSKLKKMLDYTKKFITLNILTIMMIFYCVLIVWICYKIKAITGFDVFEVYDAYKK